MTYPTTPVELTPDLEAELEETSPRALTALKKAHSLNLPKPTLNDIMELHEALKPQFSAIQSEIQAQRDLRYMREATLEKIAKDQSFGLPVHTRLSHNEGMRLSALATRNPPKGKIAPQGDGARAIKKAENQTRWGNQLIPSFQRRAQFPLWRSFADKVMNDGIAALEIHYCGGEQYDDPDQFKARQVADDKAPGGYRDEKPAEIKRRTEDALMGAKMPIGLRVIDGLSIMFPPWGDEGIEQMLIVENKTKRQVTDERRKRLSGKALAKEEAPRPGDHGTPVLSGGSPSGQSWSSFSGNPRPSDKQGDIETIRYYDGQWYAYIVEGQFEVEPVEHRLPGLPVYVCLGQVTGSPNLSELAQGITWGMGEVERAVDLMTMIAVDNALMNRDKKRIFIEQNAELGSDSAPATMDIKDPYTAKRLRPGEKAYSVDMFESSPDTETTGFLMQVYQRNGQNPVAQGQVPGANTPGYVMNSATAATNSLYESALDNLANAAAWICDFARQCVKTTVKEKVYQSVPQRGGGKATEMLGIGPDDITDVPSEFSIDPLDDINRAAKVQGLLNGMEKGLVPREVVQEEGYGAEDAQLWDDMITTDAAKQSLAAMVVQMALQRVQSIQAAQQQQAQPAGAQGAMPNGVGTGGAPAQPNPPTVGAANATASQQAYGEAGMNSNAAMSGQASQQNQGMPG